MDEQGPNISVSQLDSAMTVLLQHLPPEFRDQLENFWISLRLCLHSEYEAIRCERQALELVRQSMTNSECEHEITQRAIEGLLSNIISAQEPSTIPRPRTPNSVLNAHVRIMQEFHSSENSVTGARLRAKGDLISLIANIVPNDEVEKLKTIPPQWMRDHLEGIRDVSLDNDTGCWLSSTSTMVNPYQAQLDLGHHTSGQVWDDFKVHRKRLAIAAKGEASLLVAVPLVYQISNLCHNNSCFRPEHVEIESDELVAARKECQGRSILMLPAGGLLHPCRHWDWRGSQGHLKCILPFEHVPDDEYLQIGNDGKYIRSNNDLGEYNHNSSLQL